MRLILYSGKGGVGKTSISAATGLELARRGHRTLVMSVDPAHSLTDAFDLEKRLMDHEAGKLVSVSKNLWIQEVDVQEEIARHWESVYAYVSALLNVSGLEQTLAEELAIFPGMEEVSSLLYVNQYVRERTFDVILLDCAPTGESLRFVSIPTTLEWYMTKLFKLERRVAKMVRPMISTFASVPIPQEDYFENLQALHRKLAGIDRLMADPKVTTVQAGDKPGEGRHQGDATRLHLFLPLRAYGRCRHHEPDSAHGDSRQVFRHLEEHPGALGAEYRGVFRSCAGVARPLVRG